MVTPSNDEKIFESELNILVRGKACLREGKYQQNELLPHYQELLAHYEKLLKLTRKIFKISDAQGRVLKKRESEIRTLLDNSNQGFMTFGRDLLVHNEYSAECVKIFGQRIENRSVTELLSGDKVDLKMKLEECLSAFFSAGTDELLKENYLDQLPEMLIIRARSINIEFKQINDESGQERIMVILTDVTENLQSQERVEFLSYHDSLTSLFNRAYIEKMMPQISSSTSLPLSLILVDMNGLKLTNDVFGHQSGDALIVRASQILRQTCRRTDMIARWGGDEFLILLPNTDEQIAGVLMDQIKVDCRKVKADPIEVSLALGGATKKHGDLSFEELLSIAEGRMYKNKLLESEFFKKNMILNLKNVMRTRCFEGEGHTERIIRMATNFAKLLEIEEHSPEFMDIQLLAQLHDIGKIAIPKEILGKQGELSAEEWEIMKGHSEVGYRMAQSIGEPGVAKAILAMHERWDGKGYPYGIKGDRIPFIARVLAIVNAYDVMTHDQIYRRQLTTQEALGEMIKSSGRQFDPKLVEFFVEHIDQIVSVEEAP
ncbi:HD domain-containing phosphohydrolase [Ammoniphilus sp. CFH 90114]|uniref:sensor domain-containing diguanylate cyclase/phosphohydrolase n=1 Tax=Ammoniphilus sp. CFH 90114 TaxID=2493665 RepID=UPI00100E0379|nr:HD domain-containing phosphohydrolase [Ammoniphilus sp. CFH 90114]RXT05788.1 diguanylate cyclase [Ammoniphilus sp. CFH 90114]